jgi:phosphoribosylformylglycinamidine synthase
VGLLADGHARAGFDSMAAGDTLLVVGVSRGELGSSLYLREILGREEGAPPPVDLHAERCNGDFVRGLIASERLRTVHDLSDGGLVIAAAEMALASNLGLELDLTSAAHAHVFLFCEDQGRYLVATDQPEAIIGAAVVVGINIAEVGVAGGEAFASQGLFNIPLARLREAHEAWLPAYMATT